MVCQCALQKLRCVSKASLSRIAGDLGFESICIFLDEHVCTVCQYYDPTPLAGCPCTVCRSEQDEMLQLWYRLSNSVRCTLQEPDNYDEIRLSASRTAIVEQ